MFRTNRMLLSTTLLSLLADQSIASDQGLDEEKTNPSLSHSLTVSVTESIQSAFTQHLETFFQKKPHLRGRNNKFQDYFNTLFHLLSPDHKDFDSLEIVCNLAKQPFNEKIEWHIIYDLKKYTESLEELVKTCDQGERLTLIRTLNAVLGLLDTDSKDCRGDSYGRSIPYILKNFSELSLQVPPAQRDADSLGAAFNLSQLFFGNNQWYDMGELDNRQKIVTSLFIKACYLKDRASLIKVIHDILPLLGINGKRDNSAGYSINGVLSDFHRLYKQDRIPKIMAMMPLLIHRKIGSISLNIFTKMAKNLRLSPFKIYVDQTALLLDRAASDNELWQIVRMMEETSRIDPEALDIAHAVEVSAPLFRHNQKIGAFDKRVAHCKAIVAKLLQRHLNTHYSGISIIAQKAIEETLRQALKDLDQLPQENTDSPTDSLLVFMDDLTKKLTQLQGHLFLDSDPLRVYKKRKDTNNFGIIPVLLQIPADQRQDVVKHCVPFVKLESLPTVLKVMAEVSPGDREDLVAHSLPFKKLNSLPGILEALAKVNASDRKDLVEAVQLLQQKSGADGRGEKEKEIKHLFDELSVLSRTQLALLMARIKVIEYCGSISFHHRPKLIPLLANITHVELDEASMLCDVLSPIFGSDVTIDATLCLMNPVPKQLRQASIDRLKVLIQTLENPHKNPFCKYFTKNLADLTTLPEEEWKDIIHHGEAFKSRFDISTIVDLLKQVPKKRRADVCQMILLFKEPLNGPSSFQFAIHLKQDELLQLPRLFEALTSGVSRIGQDHRNDDFRESQKLTFNDFDKDFEPASPESRFAALSFAEPYFKDFPYLYSRMFFLDGLLAFQTDELPQVMEQMYPLLRKIRKNHRSLTSLIAKLPPAERSDAIRGAQKLSYHRGDGNDYAKIVAAMTTFPAEERSSLLDLMEDYWWRNMVSVNWLRGGYE